MKHKIELEQHLYLVEHRHLRITPDSSPNPEAMIAHYSAAQPLSENQKSAVCYPSRPSLDRPANSFFGRFVEISEVVDAAGAVAATAVAAVVAVTALVAVVVAVTAVVARVLAVIAVVAAAPVAVV